MRKTLTPDLEVICLLVAALAVVLRFVHLRENKKLEEAEKGPAVEPGVGVDDDAGLAGRRAAGFRYVY